MVSSPSLSPWYCFNEQLDEPSDISRTCDEFKTTLKDMLGDLESDGPIKETLAPFVGSCAGVAVNGKELISDVSKGLKSYEKNMNDFCALGSILKRFKRSHTYMAHLDDGQLKGFKLLVSQESKEIETKLSNGADAIEKVERKPQKKKTANLPKLVLTLKKSDKNEWKQKEEPQKIVPIYTERISGKPTRRSY